MKLLIQSAMIFFGTLMAAAVVALGEPASGQAAMKQPVPHASATATRVADNESAPGPPR